jgi:hypothetical protein
MSRMNQRLPRSTRIKISRRRSQAHPSMLETLLASNVLANLLPSVMTCQFDHPDQIDLLWNPPSEVNQDGLRTMEGIKERTIVAMMTPVRFERLLAISTDQGLPFSTVPFEAHPVHPAAESNVLSRTILLLIKRKPPWRMTKPLDPYDPLDQFRTARTVNRLLERLESFDEPRVLFRVVLPFPGDLTENLTYQMDPIDQDRIALVHHRLLQRVDRFDESRVQFRTVLLLLLE